MKHVFAWVLAAALLYPNGARTSDGFSPIPKFVQMYVARIEANGDRQLARAKQGMNRISARVGDQRQQMNLRVRVLSTSD